MQRKDGEGWAVGAGLATGLQALKRRAARTEAPTEWNAAVERFPLGFKSRTFYPRRQRDNCFKLSAPLAEWRSAGST